MLILASTTDKLQLVFPGGGAGVDYEVLVSYLDNISGSVQPGNQKTQITAPISAVDICAPPASGVFRNVKTIFINCQNPTPSGSVIVQHTDGTTIVQLHSTVIPVQGTLQYIDEVGFIIADAPRSGTPVPVFKQTITVLTNQIDIFNIGSLYDEYELHIINGQSDADQGLGYIISPNNGSTWNNGPSDYASGYMGADYLGNIAGHGLVADHGVFGGIQAKVGPAFMQSRVYFNTPSLAGVLKPMNFETHTQHPTSGYVKWDGATLFGQNTNPWNAIRLYWVGGGHWLGGTVILFGIQR